MPLGQIVLIVLGAAVTGVIIGALVSLLIRRTRRRALFGDVAAPGVPRSAELWSAEHSISAPSPLVAEVRSNFRIATGPVSGKLLPFQTQAWDTLQREGNGLSAELRYELEQTYLDVRLANSIVWLEAEFGRRTSNMDENYLKLAGGIARRLARIKPLLEQMPR